MRDGMGEVANADGSDLSLDQSIIDPVILPIIHARFFNCPTITSLKDIKGNYYGKLVSVKGTVVRMSNFRPLMKQMAVSCSSCKAVQCIRQTGGKYCMPNGCNNENCQSRYFTPSLQHRLTQTVDWQTIRLQENDDDQHESGRVPRTIECELSEDLVGSCHTGDIVTITGIVKMNQSDELKASKDKKSMFTLFIEANSIINCKCGDPTSSIGIEFSVKDYYAIEKIQSEPNLFRLLVSSLCPAIYGNEMVKAGLMLGLFGGCSKGDSSVPIRGEPHILVVGDPGLGKSQMLQACASLAPRGVYVCGNTTTTSGLTVTLTKDGSGSDFSLEGGALVMADQGICCIDEFDKMSTQHQALLEAMEQQTISIAKAGIVCSLPARASILAAANPSGGHYNKGRTVAENLKISAPLLSRFDLVFILLDKPDEVFDSLLSEHLMAVHSGVKLSTVGRKVPKQVLLDTSVNENASEKMLREVLKVHPNEDLDLIPHQLVRKYIAYARKYVKPKLSKGAIKVIQKFYLELRQKLQNSDSTPITTRQLESMIRLAEGKAKCELREDVTESDANSVVEIMKFSMVDTYSDQFGLLDFERLQHGSGTSQRAKMKKFIAALQKMSDDTYKSIFSIEEMRQLATQLNVGGGNFGEFVQVLNQQGFLLKKGPRIYQLLTAN